MRGWPEWLTICYWQPSVLLLHLRIISKLLRLYFWIAFIPTVQGMRQRTFVIHAFLQPRNRHAGDLVVNPPQECADNQLNADLCLSKCGTASECVDLKVFASSKNKGLCRIQAKHSWSSGSNPVVSDLRPQFHLRLLQCNHDSKGKGCSGKRCSGPCIGRRTSQWTERYAGKIYENHEHAPHALR